MRFGIFATAHERHLLDDRQRNRAMLWIMAIMLFLTVLAGALGLGMMHAGLSLDRQLAGRLTVQVVEPVAATRDAQTRALLALLRARPEVARAVEVDRAELAALLKPWLGDAGIDPDLPMPAMIDIDLKDGDDTAAAATERAIHAVAPHARVDRHARWLSPVRGFVATLGWLAAGLVLLMASATTAVVLLAARSGLDMHRATIEALHMLGSTDVQVARLFQRRIALDTLIGGVAGAALATVLVLVLQGQVGALGSELLGGTRLVALDWVLLALVPIAFTLLAMGAARVAVLRALGKIL
jgi:cell division transport system permease protein